MVLTYLSRRMSYMVFPVPYAPATSNISLFLEHRIWSLSTQQHACCRSRLECAHSPDTYPSSKHSSFFHTQCTHFSTLWAPIRELVPSSFGIPTKEECNLSVLSLLSLFPHLPDWNCLEGGDPILYVLYVFAFLTCGIILNF